METRIDQAALDAASAGANPPPPNRLRAAAEYVMEQARPGQLILFGSAARGEFGDGSDFDFAVVHDKPAGNSSGIEREQWYCEAADAAIDGLFTCAAALEPRRWAAGTVHCAILSEGKTVFPGRGGQRIETMRDAGGELADIPILVEQGRYDGAWAREFAGRARSRLGSADRDWSATDEDGACAMLRIAGLCALKGLIAAAGSPAVHGRDLADLWNRAETIRGKIQVRRDDSMLGKLSSCTDEPAQTTGAGEAGRIFRGVRETIEALVEHAEKQTGQRLAGRGSRR